MRTCVFDSYQDTFFLQAGIYFKDTVLIIIAPLVSFFP